MKNVMNGVNIMMNMNDKVCENSDIKYSSFA